MPDFDMSDVYEFAPFIALIGWVWFVMPNLPEQIAFLGPVGMGLPIAGMVVLEQTLQWTASKYTHIHAICRPSNVELDLYYTGYDSNEIEPGFFSTVIPLHERVKHPYWQILEYITIKHWNTLEDRLDFTERKVKFKGQEIKHGRSAIVTLYEESTSDVDHLKPVPTFYLTEAPRDFHDPTDRYRELVAPMLAANGGQLMESLSEDQRFDINKLQGTVADLSAKCTEYKRQAMNWHAIAVRGEQVIEQLKNELHAVLSSRSDQQQAVIEMFLMWAAAHVDIREGLKAAKGAYGWFKKEYVLIGLAFLALVVFVLNPDPLMFWISKREIQIFVVIIGSIVALAYVYSRRRGR